MHPQEAHSELWRLRESCVARGNLVKPHTTSVSSERPPYTPNLMFGWIDATRIEVRTGGTVKEEGAKIYLVPTGHVSPKMLAQHSQVRIDAT